jgi:Fe2+ transport system protein FeoA
MNENDEGRIASLQAGWGFRRRMAEMGFTKGSRIRLIRKGAGGPLIVEILGCCRLAIGRGEASKVMVEMDD